jgi:hypothetical protein
MIVSLPRIIARDENLFSYCLILTSCARIAALQLRFNLQTIIVRGGIMLRKFSFALLLLLMVFDVAAFAQTSKAPAKTKTPVKAKTTAKAGMDPKVIDAAIQAHVREYLGDETIPAEDLKIVAINDSEFNKLRYKLSIMGGAVRYYRGRPIPEEGCPILVEFLDPANRTDSSEESNPKTLILVMGTADGSSGIKTINNVTITEGINIQFKTGGSYVFRAGHWEKQ